MILPCLIMMFQPLNAKVEAPNYDFSVTTLEFFYPGKSLAEATAKFGKAEIVNTARGLKTHKFQVEQIRYKFPVLVQEKDGVIQDFFARLPSYFLHDVFFQSLVNKLGKQKTYKKTGEEAFYTWEDAENRFVYSAACTITCFPIFFSGERIKGGTSILEQMKKSSLGK